MEVMAVMKCMMEWGAGNFSNDKAEETAKACFNDDCVFYGDAPVKTTDIYKTYKGPMGVIEWVKNIDAIDFQNFTPSLVGVVGDKVYMKATYTPKMKSSGKEMGMQTDLHEWTIKDNKISSCKFFWGDIPALEALWA